jgi:NAD(P) transhydrogenase subunit alpha
MSGRQVATLAVVPIAAALALLAARAQQPGATPPSAPAGATAPAGTATTAPAQGQVEAAAAHTGSAPQTGGAAAHPAGAGPLDYWSMLFVFMLSTFIGIGVIRRVSRLLHTPLMSLTNAISAIAVVGSIIVAGSEYPPRIRLLGAIALFASMTNIVSGFLITDRMLKMFKGEGGRR